MTEFGRFFLPGPTEVLPEILAAQTRPMLGHRGAACAILMAGMQPVLRGVFGTSRPVYVATSSATGLMEGAVRNGVRARALSLVNGAFSARFRDLVDDCGRRSTTYEVPPGEAHDPERVREILRLGGFDAVTVVHSETSTGVLNPLPAIAAAVRDAERETGDEILLLVDGVTSVGGMEIGAEAWGLDFLLTGSQKALALPPGLALGAASPRMLARAETLPGRGQYFDLPEFEAYARKDQSPTTPAVSLLHALDAQCRRIAAETVAGRAARHAAMMERCHAWTLDTGRRWGLGLLAPEGARSPTVTTITLPEGRPSGPVVQGLEARGWVIGGGYGTLKETTIRIGHMGDHTLDGVNALLARLEEVLG